MKLLFGFFVAAVVAFCCLTQTGTGAAPQDMDRRAEPVVGGGATAFDHEVSRDAAEAVGSIRKAAEQGNARAQAELGNIYKDGKGAARDDAVAAAWYRKA